MTNVKTIEEIRDELPFCGCGSSYKQKLDFVKELTNINWWNMWLDGKDKVEHGGQDFKEFVQKNWELTYEFMMGTLSDIDLVEHGGNINGCWRDQDHDLFKLTDEQIKELDMEEH